MSMYPYRFNNSTYIDSQKALYSAKILRSKWSIYSLIPPYFTKPKKKKAEIVRSGSSRKRDVKPLKINVNKSIYSFN